ncbi:MAG: type II secretion system F family protein [Alphaproteobacteria bacterium]|nr:type II secretion system F family protein [Alphaproteobacteria bacterium]
MNPQLLVMIAGGVLFTFVILLLLFGGDGTEASVKKRLDRVGGTTPAKNLKESGSAATLRRRTSDSEIALLDRIIKTTLPNPEKMRARLAATGKNISLSEYLMVNLLGILVSYLIFAYIVKWGPVVAFFMAIAVGLYLPHMVTGRMGRKRINKFLATFPEAIDTICRGLRSGLPITETIAAVGLELPDPIGIEFTRISDGVRMGRSLEESMWEVAGRLDIPEYRFFIIALAIQRETGGNLAETLGNLAELLRKRRQLKLKIRAMSSEARASAMIIGSLPFLMFTLLYFVNSDYIMILLHDTRGKFLFGGGLTWLSMGVFVMKQMINFEI